MAKELTPAIANGDGEIVACDNCLEELDAWEWSESELSEGQSLPF
jgi:hypothetical protein